MIKGKKTQPLETKQASEQDSNMAQIWNDQARNLK